MESIKATREEVERFLSIQKYGYISDCGSDYGYGYGYGCGNRNGNGCGGGEGGGYGCGDGHGCGRGFGSGFGRGFGYGSAFDYGDITALNGNIVDYVDDVPTIITQVHNNFAKGYIVKDDLTLDFCFIAKVGDFFAHGKTLKDAVADAEAKIENMPIEERIKKFREVFGSLDSKHTGKAFYDWHHILTGSCRLGRDKFCKSRNIDLTQKYTVKYFLDITKGSYGRKVIKLIEKTYKDR